MDVHLEAVIRAAFLLLAFPAALYVVFRLFLNRGGYGNAIFDFIDLSRSRKLMVFGYLLVLIALGVSWGGLDSYAQNHCVA